MHSVPCAALAYTCKGIWISWSKLLVDQGTYKPVKMGDVWTCCKAETQFAPACSKAIELSDLHTKCIKCGKYFYTFEHPEKCKYHPGKLTSREIVGNVYRWTCCERMTGAHHSAALFLDRAPCLIMQVLLGGKDRMKAF